SDRGSQILCQIQRLSKMISYQIRRIGLSATIGKPEESAAWLQSGSDRACEIVEIKSEQHSWKLALEHFFESENETEVSPADAFIYKATKGKKCVVFSDSREKTESITASLRILAKKKGEDDRFHIHHGSLSESIREETERCLKSTEANITACATVSLELGIDISQLKRIINQEAPNSVSSFLQRLGRSGRRDEAPEMIMVFREEENLHGAPFYQSIPWQLLQGIAIIELYRGERWIEPAEKKLLPASLLFHQTLSILASKGGLSAPRLASEVLSLSPFSSFSKEQYKSLLIHMIRENYLDFTEEKEVIVGLKGERLLSNFKFYAVFKDNEDFTVRLGSEEIGTITWVPPIGERFALAGKVWSVEELDVSKKIIYVKQEDGKMNISWSGSNGLIHTKILEKIKEILCSDVIYPYLLPGATKRLAEARKLAKIVRFSEKNLMGLGEDNFVLFPWLGTKAFQSLKRLLEKESSFEISDLKSTSCYYITFKSKKSGEDILALLNEKLKDEFLTCKSLITKTEHPIFDKYDACLPQELLLDSFAENQLNLDEVKGKIYR
ncbi:MAG: ATP-dependent helicase, partial [Clostridia bacterium]|nr:ATP-dependent helicase [Clostridia bacterium]